MRFGMTELLIILGIVVLVFGTKRLKNIGKDMGGAIADFKDAMDKPNSSETSNNVESTPIESKNLSESKAAKDKETA